MSSPYHDLPPEAFWRSGVVETAVPLGRVIWSGPPLARDARIFVLGDAFAGALHRALIAAGADVIESEPPPAQTPPEVLARFGWGQGSARTGPLRAPREVAQLLREASGRRLPRDPLRFKRGRHVDVIRPTVEPEGFDSAEAATEARDQHLSGLVTGLGGADVVLICLSRDGGFEDRQTRTAHPAEAQALIPRIVPYTATLAQIDAEFGSIWRDLRTLAPRARVLLVQSPTVEADWPEATGGSAALRVAMARMEGRGARISYVPLHELLTAPGQGALLTPDGCPTEAGIDAALTLLLGAPQRPSPAPATEDTVEGEDEIACEEVLYEAFAPKARD